ncbi:hypothetical protein L3Q65_22755 [Amycolatopsis sp. FU40]|uniref:hypothetical protein n=1 Tax=Amycolatopsis sp. FU40 TaxID=2914159 RepID=UPI001F339F4E|nr:hypothetical protein [Amycolatopsis sp. FU40]UKD59421.1 hypothetical protein L3Q65_22755 [Amycolatopsis sp. FU40]
MCPHPGLPAATADNVDAPAAPGGESGAVARIGEAGPVGLLPDTEPVGEFRGSGYREPPLLVARTDGQLVRLPALLYLIVRLLVAQEAFVPEEQEETENRDDAATLAKVAAAASEESGLRLEAEHVAYLLDRKLAPLGLTTCADGTVPELARHNPFLALRVRVQVLAPAATWVVGGMLGWLFFPVVIALLLAAAGVAEWWLLAGHSVSDAMSSTLADPVGVLAVLGLAVASTGFHECGHAAACRYSGAVPGGMGAGIYLVWPAFYTDITDTYRLNRAGRLRTDLGGVYFNAIFALALAAAYFSTGWAPLLVAVLSVNLEIVQQLLPTLRFDGYYLMADLVGVPDLYRYIGPILSHYLLRRPRDARLDALKRWPQTAVTTWVLLIVPALALELGYVAWQVPGLVRTDVQAVSGLISHAAADPHPVLGAISAAVQILLLALPIAGIAAIAWQLGRALWRLARLRLPGLVRKITDGPEPARARRRRLAFGALAAALAIPVGGGVGWALGVLPGSRPAEPAAASPAPAQPEQRPSTSSSALSPSSPSPAPAPSDAVAAQETAQEPTPRAETRRPARHSTPRSRTQRPAGPTGPAGSTGHRDTGAPAPRPGPNGGGPSAGQPPAESGPPPLSPTQSPSCPLLGVSMNC